MTLKDRITEDMKTAHAREGGRAAVDDPPAARGDQAARGRRAQGAAPTPTSLAIIDKMVKQRRDSITQFEAGEREDLVAAEQAEIEVLQGYLPQQLSEAEIDAVVAAAIAADRRRRSGGHGQGHGAS